jgi:hypothetical protein
VGSEIGDGESAAFALEWKHLLLDGEIGGMSLAIFAPLEPREIYSLHPVLLREHPGHVGFLDVTELDEVVTDAGSALLLLVKRALELIHCDQALAHEHVTDAIGNGGCSCQ